MLNVNEEISTFVFTYPIIQPSLLLYYFLSFLESIKNYILPNSIVQKTHLVINEIKRSSKISFIWIHDHMDIFESILVHHAANNPTPNSTTDFTLIIFSDGKKIFHNHIISGKSYGTLTLR